MANTEMLSALSGIHDARAYERMLALLWLRALSRPSDRYQVAIPLAPRPPAPDRVAVEQGHY